MPGLHVFDTPAAMLAAAVAAVGAAAAESIAARGNFALALTGGSVARSVHPVLAESGLVDWIRTHVWWSDERCVPPDDAESNYALGVETLLRHVPVPKDHVHRMKADDPDLDWAARDYAASLPRKLDLMLLGLGADGHLCSLFPDRPQLAETERLVVPVVDSPKPPLRRLTVTPPVIADARRLLVIVAGEEKAAAVAAAFQDGPASELPARLARHGTWIVLRDAAKNLVQPK